jgi:uncharacterized Zn-binding protein involved in type VI secretion
MIQFIFYRDIYVGEVITVGSKTSTGGVVKTGNGGVKINGQSVALIGDTATCLCGNKSCRGQGAIVPQSSRAANVSGVDLARVGDLVDTGCGSCFLEASSHQVSLTTSTTSPLNMGSGINIGNGVNINGGAGVNFGRGVSNNKMATSSTVTQKSRPETPLAQVNPNNMYWPPYNPVAADGEKELHVEYVTPIISIAVLSLEEAQELYDNLGGKSILGNAKDYGGLAKSTAEAYITAKGLGGLGVKSYTKNINGKDWIIIKDYKKVSKTLEAGSKWGANNPRIVQMGLGLNDLKGASRYVKFNVGIEIAFAVGINAADFIMRDEATLSEFVGNSAGDLVKGVISLAGAAVVTAIFVPAATILTTGIVFAIASFAIGQSLNIFDENKGYTKGITEAVEGYYNANS